MSQSSNIKLFTLSLLCGAVLTACGGGGGDTGYSFTTGESSDEATDNGSTPGSGDKNNTNTDKKPSEKKPGIPGEIEPTVNKLLVDIANQGQQNYPSVASINNDGDGNVEIPVTKNDDIRFNQQAMVSEVCGWGGDCVDKAAIKKVDSLRKQAESTDDKQKKAQLNKWADNIEDQFPEEGKKAIRDVNGVIVIPKSLNTVDFGNIPSKDLGVLKIDRKRKADGTVMKYNGTIDRAFGSVIGFQIINQEDPKDNKETLYLNSFFRNPANAGWSYQTFGNYFSNTEKPLLGFLRGQNVGYQSIGKITESVPISGKFTYTGISHAYYDHNGTAQVTSHNKITANFAEKHLTYETTDIAKLHTMENGLHFIEDRKDLNVSGSADWTDKNRFRGTVSTSSGLKGYIEGQFYGPNAEEVGGVYGLGSGTTTHYVGGFGAKK